MITQPSRPLLISDCDEVLLHMVRHFGSWLGEAHEIDFEPTSWELGRNMRRRHDGGVPSREEMMGFLDGFFPGEMHRQTLVPHAREALAQIAEVADIVILTNLQDQCRSHRIDQLAAFGIEHRVECNQGPKGGPVAALVAEHGNPVTVFIDDLPMHHQSVAELAPHVHRLHMVAEPTLAPGVPPAPAAHARIDVWPEALTWITDRFAAGQPAQH
ncbi:MULTISPECIES: HAD family hydrolase [unclassified Sphingomonas]|uniref:HAD family hydrolase n=1 Tax=unclassified Sphingomonas TaxID=196159 RepID=UPI001D108048|nr:MULTISPECIES: HAD family hydrolase [unclassified Sphingomonas]MCC2979620.1 HAD family hydrolase [Sphingomonas sp. IC4-52]MCD2315150.1 HAD family hydrolase [Sphingomonas sp. IC-11]